MERDRKFRIDPEWSSGRVKLLMIAIRQDDGDMASQIMEGIARKTSKEDAKMIFSIAVRELGEEGWGPGQLPT